MRNGLARHVKTNVKDQVKQNVCESECCYHCAHARTGYFSDTMRCGESGGDVFKTGWCPKFERRE